MSAPETADGKTRLLRVAMYVKRRPSMSEDDFNKHWSEKHAPLVSEWLARHGIVRYVQVCISGFPEQALNEGSMDVRSPSPSTTRRLA